MDTGRHYAEQARRDCAELGMSQQEISRLINEDPEQRTGKLISLFNSNSDERRKRKILKVLNYLGDEELAGNFCADLYQRPDLRPSMKFWIAMLGELRKFRRHQRLHAVLDAHLKGESPAKVLLRALYPDGQTCRVKKERRLRQLQGPPAERPDESTHSSEARFTKKPTHE